MKRLLILICTIINAVSAQYPDYVQSTNLGTNDLILIAHWNGSSWNQTMSITGTNLMSQIISLIPASTNNIWSVDTNGTIQATSAAPDGQDSFILNTQAHDGSSSGLFMVTNGTNELCELYGNTTGLGGWLELFNNAKTATATTYVQELYSYFDVTYDDGIDAGEVTITGAAAGPNIYFYHSINYDEVAHLVPASAPSQTPYLFDTSVEHTSGNLMELNNHGVDRFYFDYGGLLTTFGDASGLSAYNSDVSKTSDYNAGYMDILSGASIIYLDVAAPSNSPVAFFDSDKVHTSGNLGAFLNDGTNVVQITATTATSTNTPFILNIHGTQKEVFLGPADSAGTGLRALSVVN